MASYDPGERRVSIFADSEQGRRNVEAMAERVHAHVIFGGSVQDGVSRLVENVPGDALLVDLTDADDPSFDLFLDRLDLVARSQRLPVLVNIAPECIDPVSARLNAPSVALMAQATAVDWVSALALLNTERAPVLKEVASEDGLRLQRLTDEVERIARTLADLAGSAPVPLRGVSDSMIGYRVEPTSFRPQQVVVTAHDVRAIIRLRRMRDRYFRSDLFADPAWDMLLDLTAARIDRVRVAVSSLCIAAAVPPTTALRWIKTMTDTGLFVRVADDEDGRRVFIELSEAAATGMMSYLSAAKAQGGLAI